ncbi:Integrase core domain protein [Gimesia algae]|uniref:Integrase core domain protein n=1 Tax=Gimesia algae TaxID=2527971 RepID=A0A517VA37_9PLAN|nr:Integrase core domain protein [Gimesia algae]QDT89263.1 Integrase core domain protein [Gimesia algae]QDT89810.1 Integrase core domain protein [Gimesia algae]QDT89830.1 Integrase core domain protein [Gimesia algae]QDT89874.1 Integrase core domain protein [Gimesia algae]
MDDYGRIRRAHRDGMSIREIARTFHHSRRKIREVLHGAGQPQQYSQRQTQAAPRLGPFHETIRQILADDESQPPKQRHTAQRIFERLRDEHGYLGGYDAVCRFVRKHRTNKRETFIPLDHQPGQRLEADFGKIYVDFPDGRRRVSVLILVWSYSNAPFVIALPTERTEAILEGMVQAFEYFDRVPKEVWWDNPKTVADAVLSGRSRKINQRYAALASHYVFEPLFCLPASGNEKPVVENRVKTLQRKWSTPVPKMEDFEELNNYLRQCCLQEQQRLSSGKTETIGTRLEQDKQNAAGLPRHRFDPCIRREVKVNKYQFARFENVDYSVPRQCAFQTVSVKGYVDRVEMVFKGTVVATHQRSYEKGCQILNPLHYLAALGRRPAALDHSNVYRQWKLPPVFDELRERLENRHGLCAGAKQYVRVLQLLSAHPVQRVQKTIEQLRGPEGADADRIIRRVKRSTAHARNQPDFSPATLSKEELSRPEVLSVQVPCPSLNHFDLFLSTSTQGDHRAPTNNTEEKRSESTAAEQSQAVKVTGHECGVREVGPRSGQLKSDVRAISAAVD